MEETNTKTNTKFRIKKPCKMCGRKIIKSGFDEHKTQCISKFNNIKTIKNIIMVQSLIRRWLANKNNIFKKMKKITIKNAFEMELKGYHMINSIPIKESVWEDFNCKFISGECVIRDEANGNHKSGKDNKFDNWNVSNKTIKIGKDLINISSYRLSKVCSNKNIGNKTNIIEEIRKRDGSFEYYSILAREEIITLNELLINYIWYIIPKSYYIFQLDNELEHKFGKQGENKNTITGWKSKYFDITFSMSSQLWYRFNKNLIDKYKIHEVLINNSNNKISYSDIYNFYDSE